MRLEDFTDGQDPSGNPNNPNNTGTPNTGGGGQGIPFARMTPPPADADEAPDSLTNYNDIADTFDKALFRDDELDRMITILSSKKKANALLIGDAGVGKTQLVEEFARRYVVDKDPVLIERFGDDLQIEELRISALISGKSLVGQLEKEVEKVLDYAKDNNVIIFIDELHRLFSDQVAGNVGQDLKQALARQDMKFIAATTTQEVKVIREESAFNRRWSDVIVDEMTPEQTEVILQNAKSSYEKHHGVQVPDHLLATIVHYGDLYKRSGSHRPDSGLTLLDRVCAYVGIEGIKMKQSTDPAIQHYLQANPIPRVSKKDVIKISKSLVQKSTVQSPTEPISEALDKRIIGQDDAKSKVAETVNRLQLNILQPKRPHSFLFAGPSGTGKTEMAKQLAMYLFGNEKSMIRLDMSEFSESSSINRIKGSPDGYVGSTSKQPLPFDSLESNPHQIILVDEIEKAHAEVRLLFMQILDEGSFTTERHNTIDFSRAIIIATTNAGAQTLDTPSIGFSQPKRKSESDVIDALKEDFPVELLNRFEHIVAFDALTKDQYKQVLAIKYNTIIKEAKQNRPDLNFQPETIDMNDETELELLTNLANDSFKPQLNGRPAERTVQQHIENHLLAHMNDVKQVIFEPITPTAQTVPAVERNEVD